MRLNNFPISFILPDLRPLQASNPKFEFIQCLLLRMLTFQMDKVDQSGVRLILVFVINVGQIKSQSEPQVIHMLLRDSIFIQNLDRRHQTVAVRCLCIQIDGHAAHDIPGAVSNQDIIDSFLCHPLMQVTVK